MTDCTISIHPIPPNTTADSLKILLKQFQIIRVFVNSKKLTAYVELDDLQLLGMKYEDCKIPQLNNAEINVVEAGFKWEIDCSQSNQKPLQSKINVNVDCFVRIKDCDSLANVSIEDIKLIFKQFQIEKIVKFQNTHQVVLQFKNQEDLELLQMQYVEWKVPQLGVGAKIDQNSHVDVKKFIDEYRRQLSQDKNEEKIQYTTKIQIDREQFQDRFQEQKEQMMKEQQRKRLIQQQKRKQQQQIKKKEQELKRKKIEQEESRRKWLAQEQQKRKKIQLEKKQKEEKQRKQKQEREKIERQQEIKRKQAQQQQRKQKQLKQRDIKLQRQKMEQEKQQRELKQKRQRQDKQRQQKLQKIQKQQQKKKEQNERLEREKQDKLKFEAIQKSKKEQIEKEKNLKAIQQLELKKQKQQKQKSDQEKKRKQEEKQKNQLDLRKQRADKEKQKIEEGNKKINKQQKISNDEQQLINLIQESKKIDPATKLSIQENSSKKQIRLPLIHQQQFSIKPQAPIEQKSLKIENKKVSHLITFVLLAWIAYLVSTA